MSVLHCTCCGSEVTQPCFYEGKVYGYSCVKKVAGSGVKAPKTKYFAITPIKEDDHSVYFNIEIFKNVFGAIKTKRVRMWLNKNDKDVVYQDGVYFIPDTFAGRFTIEGFKPSKTNWTPV